MERKDYERYVTSLIMIEADNSFIVWHLQCKQNILGPKLPRRKTVFIFFSELYSYKIAGQQKKIINPGPISFHLSFWSAKKTIIKIITYLRRGNWVHQHKNKSKLREILKNSFPQAVTFWNGKRPTSRKFSFVFLETPKIFASSLKILF